MTIGRRADFYKASADRGLAGTGQERPCCLQGSINRAVALVRSAGRNGIVLSEQPPYTCVLVEQPEGGTDPQLLAANHGWLVRYQFAEDHGMWIDLYDHARRKGRIALEWGPDFLGNGALRAQFDPAPWLATGLLDAARTTELQQLADGPDPSAGYKAARLLGLSQFEGLSCDPTNPKRGPWQRVVERVCAKFPHAIVVGLDPSS